MGNCTWAKTWWMATQVTLTVLRLDLHLMSDLPTQVLKGSDKCR
jgi:hypothetical protein